MTGETETDHGLMYQLVGYIRMRRYLYKIRHLPTATQPYPVLDIGCGRFPVPLADIVADRERYEYDRVELRKRLLGRFVVCDIQNLPFGDGVFGFVHCSNVLEHVDDPCKAFAELKRVGRHGFAECPNAFRETMIIHPHDHQWVVNWRKGQITFHRPKFITIGRTQILPPPFTPWIRLRFRFLWKCFMQVMDQMLGIAFNSVRW